MDVCLVCLEINKEGVSGIKVNSMQWQEQEIKLTIEKHLWSLDTVRAYYWICKSCWQVLDDFHKFYIRIEEAHHNLKILLKTEGESNLFQGDCKHLFDKDTTIEDQLDSEILMEQPLPKEFQIENENLLIKQELGDDLSSEDMPLAQKRKRRRTHKNLHNDINDNLEDPLNKSRKTKSNKTKPITHKKLKELNKRSCNFKLSAQHQNAAKTLIKHESNVLDAVDITDSGESENYNNSLPLKTFKKKRKNPDEKTSQEYDRFISENFQIICSLCQVNIETFIALRKHFREEHKKRGFVICCKKKIFSRPLLVDHIHIHLDPNYFKCKKCEKIYSERSTLESHVKIHEMSQQDRNHICDICGKSFVGNTQLENHKQIHAPDYEKKFSCTECGKFFATSYSLNYHIQAIHQNKYVNICDICGKTMRCRNQFKLHMEKHDSKLAAAINCDICGLLLTDRRGLRRHKNSQHPVGGKKEYTCHLCSKISPNQEALRTHIRLTHGTNYNHKCTMCDKAFKRPYALREHMATHTGTALYSCPWCPKTFISNGNMHNHRKKSHPKEWEEAHRKRFAHNELPLKN